jgi:hypothetical protein
MLSLIHAKARQIHKNISVSQMLRWYEKEGEELVGELPLVNIELRGRLKRVGFNERISFSENCT